MGGIKHAIDEAANEILRSNGIDRGVGSEHELEEAERFLLEKEGRLALLSHKYDRDIIEDFLRNGVEPGPEYFE